MIVSAEFSRGAGLGNKLFPWARAKLFSRNHACRMLQTRWFSPHGGGITRGGVDYSKVIRKILLVGNFKHDPEAIGALWGMLRYGSWPIIKCPSLSEVPEVIDTASRSHVCFSWNTNHNFVDFAGEQTYIKNSLEKITLQSQLRYVESVPEKEFIGINVRCGKDFVAAGSKKIGYVQTDLEWFCSALAEIRRNYGDLPAIVVSDGGPKQLHRLLEMNNVRLLNAPSAIADLLTLAKARVLLGSGNSSFSAWASFLGEMDTYSSVDTPFKYEGLEDGRNGNKIVGVI